MSSARKTADSTVRRILRHTAEIIMSIILLIIICVPLAFVIPMWLQQIALSSAVESLVVNPVAWFGYAGAVGVTILLSLVSIILGYAYLMGMSPCSETGKKESQDRDTSEKESGAGEESTE